MRCFRKGTRRRLFYLLITVVSVYTIWKSWHSSSDTELLKLEPRIVSKQLKSAGSSCRDCDTAKPIQPSDAQKIKPFDDWKPSFTSHGTVELNSLQNISQAYSNKWVGFPDLANVCDCRLALNKSTSKNGLFPMTVTRVYPGDYIADSRNCTAFVHKYGFSRYPRVTEEEKAFPLAYIVLFHQDLDQVVFLLRAIYRSHNVYCLSIDTKAKIEYLEAVKSIAKCLPNVFVARQLESVVYSGFTRLMADIDCMKDLVVHPVPWKYLANLPGQEFPLRTNLELVKIFKIYNGANDIEGVAQNRMIAGRFQFKHKYVRDSKTGELKLTKTGEQNPPPPHNLEIVKGSAYNTFSREFILFVVHDPVAKDFLEWSRFVSSPDEYYWATLHHSKVVKVPGGFTAGPPEGKLWVATYASWAPRDPCATIHRHGICIFSTEDVPDLLERHQLFANKFYITHHPAALHCLDEFLYNLTLSRRTRDLSFYQQLPFILKNNNSVVNGV